MDPIEAFENFVITLIAGFALVQLVVLVCAPILAIVILIWWLQTLMLCLREETGDDKTTYTLVIVFLGPLGALIYRLSRTGRVPGNVQARRSQPDPNAPWLQHPSGTSRRSRSASEPPHYTTGQVVTIAIASLLVGVMLVCITLVAFSAWYEPPLPTAAPTPSAAEQFATEGPQAIMGTLSAIATQSSEVMRTSAAITSP